MQFSFKSFIDIFHLFVHLFSFLSNNYRAVSDRAVIKPPTYFHTIIIKANDTKEDMNHCFLGSQTFFFKLTLNHESSDMTYHLMN